MGIKGLFPLIFDNAPTAVKNLDFKALGGRKVAIDASMSLYQFLIAVRQTDGQQLQNEEGETTSHLVGMFHRTIRIVDNGIKPVYVFDGKPPELKSGELAKRLARRDEAERKQEEIKETGTAEEISRYERRQVKVTRDQNEEAKKLLKLMGVPYVEAPGEAEAQCAELAREKKVYASASEDMDTLTFNTPILLRHMTAPESKKQPVVEIDTEKALALLELTREQFIDLCILLGCDYCDPIRGVGPATAFKLIKEYKSLEKIVEHLRAKEGKIKVPEDWPFEEVRKLFSNPEVTPAKDIDIKWGEPDVEGLVEFLCKQKGFSEDRVRAGAAKLKKGSKTTPQGRIMDFFTAQPQSKGEMQAAAKRKKEALAAEKAKKKAKITSKKR
ncbi:flap endonuclease 1 [Trichomonascus vanleenenianus]|uniref:multifunctional nuclease RAD27 n=1 Tax=Trichomonascus vanleenenianus TaxID=2268995 RepID=UPI003ECA79ED